MKLTKILLIVAGFILLAGPGYILAILASSQMTSDRSAYATSVPPWQTRAAELSTQLNQSSIDLADSRTKTVYPTYTPYPTQTFLPTFTIPPTQTARVVIVTPTYTATPLFTPTNTLTPTQTIPPTPTPDPLKTIKGPGYYLVGKDIASGVWRSNGTGNDCYWEIDTLTGDIINNHFGLAGGTMYIPPTAFQVRMEAGCGNWAFLQ